LFRTRLKLPIATGGFGHATDRNGADTARNAKDADGRYRCSHMFGPAGRSDVKELVARGKGMALPSMSNNRFTRVVSDGSANRVIVRRDPHDMGEDMKTSTLAISSILAAAASISGCAVDIATQQRATAFAIGGTAVSPDQIRISNQLAAVESSGVVHRWHASAPNGEYDCSAVQGEQLLVQPVCVKK
jgi:hypothetical protein